MKTYFQGYVKTIWEYIDGSPKLDEGCAYEWFRSALAQYENHKDVTSIEVMQYVGEDPFPAKTIIEWQKPLSKKEMIEL